MIDTDIWTVCDAVTTSGHPILLVADNDGDYFIVEQLAFAGGDSRLVAHKIGPGDRLCAGVQRFATLTFPND